MASPTPLRGAAHAVAVLVLVLVPGAISSGALAAAPAPTPEAMPATDSLLFRPQAVRRDLFARMDEISPTRTVRAGETTKPLPSGAAPMPPVIYTVDGATFTLDDYLARPATRGLLVVKDGRVLLEHHADGHDAATRWVSFSVTKSVTSMLIGAAIADGYIDSVDEPVTHYLPRLRGTPYEDVTLEQVLHMASGVAWNEDYADPDSDVARAGAMNGIELVAYLGELPRAHAPGTVFNYNTGETNLGGEILRAAIGNNASTYLEHRIWQTFGMEADATWLLGDPGGGETGGCCINATLGDYARIGLFAMGGGMLADGTRVLPEGWMAASTTPSPGADDYGYQWWLEGDGAFAARGIFGQLILVDPARDLVIAQHGNFAAAVGSADHAHMNAVIDAIRTALD